MPITLPENPEFLAEEANWEAAIYQIKTDDPVVGGPTGISNLHARQIANRTAFLKQQLEAGSTALTAHEASNNHPLATTAAKGMVVLATIAEAVAGLIDDKAVTPVGLAAAVDAMIDAAVAALVASSPATLDTLNELAAALGNDPNFATTMAAALAGKAPLASPALTGTPTAPTAAAGTDTTQIATTAFVLAQLLAGGYAQLAVAQTFTKAQRGGVIALVDGATVTPDFSAGNHFALTLSGNRTLANPTNMAAGQSGIVVLTQDATGGRTLAFGSYWKFTGGSAPSLTSSAGAVDVLAYYVEGANRISARIHNDVK